MNAGIRRITHTVEGKEHGIVWLRGPVQTREPGGVPHQQKFAVMIVNCCAFSRHRLGTAQDRKPASASTPNQLEQQPELGQPQLNTDAHVLFSFGGDRCTLSTNGQSLSSSAPVLGCLRQVAR